MKKIITIYDIAKESNVSPATVSRILTGNAKVSPQKREAVENIIKKYDFHPSHLDKHRCKCKQIFFQDVLQSFSKSLNLRDWVAVNAHSLAQYWNFMFCLSGTSAE